MKKKLLFLALALSVTGGLFSQDYPNCSHLRVENIAFTTPGMIDIEISNSCTDCRSGIDGCVYAEMKLYRSVAPFDLLAQTDCWCNMAPNNNDTFIYMLDTELTEVPPISEMTLWFNCGTSGFCDSVPFSTALTTGSIETTEMLALYPNPSSDYISISLPRNLASVFVKISDVTGKLVLDKKIAPDSEKISIAGLSSGMYIATISDEAGYKLKDLKFIKE